MKIGMPITGSIPADEFIRRARFAESMGVEYIESINRAGPFDRDPLINLSLLVQNTETANVGAYSMDPFMYHPVSVSRAMATLDEIAPGRVYLGWVAGYQGIESTGFGPASRKPLRYIREAIELSKLCLSGNLPSEYVSQEASGLTVPIPDEYLVHYVGEHYQLANGVVLPSRKVPVWLCSFSPKMLQLGGEIADEVLTGWVANPGGNDWALEQIAIGAARGGRSLDDIRLHRAIHVGIWHDRQEAIEAITPISQVTLMLTAEHRKRFGIKLPFEREAGEVGVEGSEAQKYAFDKLLPALLGQPTDLADEIPLEIHLQQVVAGTPDDCIEQLLGTVIDPRFDVLHFAPFMPPPEDENWYTGVELFMKEVVPALRL